MIVLVFYLVAEYSYDLLSTMVYDTIAKRFAMSIGGETRMGMLHRAHFEQMAKSCGLRPKLVLTELDDMAKALPSMAQSLANELNSRYPSAVYGKCAGNQETLSSSHGLNIASRTPFLIALKMTSRKKRYPAQ